MSNISKLIFWVIAISIPVLAQQKSTKAKPASQLGTHATPNLPSEDEVNAFLHATFGYDPQLTWKIVGIRQSEAEGLAEVNVQVSGPQGQGEQKFFVSEDGKHAVVGDIIPFGAHPFERARLVLEKRANGPARGPANAPVTIVEFSDLQCPHCKEANPTIEKLLADDPNVRFISQNFPLPMHNWAMKAAEYADCVARASSDAYWKFADSIFDAQSEITADNADQKLTDLADKAGVNGQDIAACAAKPEAESHVQASLNLGKSLDVNSTPTLFINGRAVGVSGNNYEVLKQIVDFASKEK
ncbi:MAG TPA: thioredoxin domain-containing protein [Terriglobales bacterium]|nr:thioredoxin domain-containing protein [Terriglobales bacterium]